MDALQASWIDRAGGWAPDADCMVRARRRRRRVSDAAGAIPRVHPRISRRFRIAGIGVPSARLAQLVDGLRRRDAVDVVDGQSPLGLGEWLAFRRVDLLLVEAGAVTVDSLAGIRTAVVPRGAQVVPRVLITGPALPLPSSEIDAWIDAALDVAPRLEHPPR